MQSQPQPPHESDSPKPPGNPWIKWVVIAVAVIVVGSGAWYAFGYFAAKGTIDAINDTVSGDRSTSVPVVPGDVRTERYPSRLSIADVTGDQFVGLDTMYPYSYTRQEQLDYAGTKLNTDMQATAERMRDRIGAHTTFFTEDDGKTVRTVVKPALDNTPQQIWDQVTVGSFQVWEEAQNGNIEEAKKLAAVANDPAHREYQDEISTFSITDAAAVNNNGVAWNEKPVITSGEYEGISATPTSPLIEFNVNIGGNDSGNRIKAVLRFEQGSSSDANRWVLVTTHDQ